MTELSSPDNVAAFREKFFSNPEFRDELASGSDGVLAELLSPLDERVAAPEFAFGPSQWASEIDYPDKRNEEARIW